jgi:hypothetical protein
MIKNGNNLLENSLLRNEVNNAHIDSKYFNNSLIAYVEEIKEKINNY